MYQISLIDSQGLNVQDCKTERASHVKFIMFSDKRKVMSYRVDPCWVFIMLKLLYLGDIFHSPPITFQNNKNTEGAKC